MKTRKKPIKEVMSLQSKQDKKMLREKLGITQRELKSIIAKHKQNTHNVENGFIGIEIGASAGIGESQLIQKPRQTKPKEQQGQYTQMKEDNSSQHQHLSKNGWNFRLNLGENIYLELSGQEDETPKSVIYIPYIIGFSAVWFIVKKYCRKR